MIHVYDLFINEIINEMAMDTKNARYELLSLLHSVVTCIERLGFNFTSTSLL